MGTVTAAEDLIKQAQTAAEAKNLKGVITAGKEWLKHLMIAAKEFAEQMEAAGEPVSNEERKEIVIKAAQEKFTPMINQVFNVPLLSEQVEARIIDAGIRQFISKTIDITYQILKKNGWSA